eukprot:137062-Chlamydomonas_euryale.AAC.2
MAGGGGATAAACVDEVAVAQSQRQGMHAACWASAGSSGIAVRTSPNLPPTLVMVMGPVSMPDFCSRTCPARSNSEAASTAISRRRVFLNHVADAVQCEAAAPTLACVRGLRPGKTTFAMLGG